MCKTFIRLPLSLKHTQIGLVDALDCFVLGVSSIPTQARSGLRCAKRSFAACATALSANGDDL